MDRRSGIRAVWRALVSPTCGVLAHQQQGVVPRTSRQILGGMERLEERVLFTATPPGGATGEPLTVDVGGPLAAPQVATVWAGDQFVKIDPIDRITSFDGFASGNDPLPQVRRRLEQRSG